MKACVTVNKRSVVLDSVVCTPSMQTNKRTQRSTQVTLLDNYCVSWLLWSSMKADATHGQTGSDWSIVLNAPTTAPSSAPSGAEIPLSIQIHSRYCAANGRRTLAHPSKHLPSHLTDTCPNWTHAGHLPPARIFSRKCLIRGASVPQVFRKCQQV
jgi:hypothetical protein